MRWSEVLKSLTDVIQAGCAVGLLVLGFYGYVYTVLPLYSKAVLEEENSRLTLDSEKLKKEKTDLQYQVAKEEKNLNDYRRTVIPYVTEQFINKISSKADSYKCSPTVFDIGFPERQIPEPATGASLIKANLKNQEFNLLPESEKQTLIENVDKFVAGYPIDELSLKLQVIHAAHFTGPLAGLSQKWADPFKFCRGEHANVDHALQLFGKALTALQTQLSSNQQTIQFTPCNNLGVLPECTSAHSP